MIVLGAGTSKTLQSRPHHRNQFGSLPRPSYTARRSVAAAARALGGGHRVVDQVAGDQRVGRAGRAGLQVALVNIQLGVAVAARGLLEGGAGTLVHGDSPVEVGGAGGLCEPSTCQIYHRHKIKASA